ncbi:MAG: hypothetical protein IPO21_09920 [Bacteroidales bacterium]|nr:hypothetical protein [Bacteroidales bacterium]
MFYSYIKMLLKSFILFYLLFFSVNNLLAQTPDNPLVSKVSKTPTSVDNIQDSTDVKSTSDSLKTKRKVDTLNFAISAWNYDEFFLEKKSIILDTVIEKFHLKSTIDSKYSFFQSLGNIGTPVSPYNLIDKKNSFVYFLDAYSLYYYNPNEQVFYNTHRPFTNIHYTSGPKKQQLVDFIHTQNIHRDLNIGLTLNFFNSLGLYGKNISSSNGSKISVWSSYSSGKYKTNISYFFGRNFIDENGGLVDDSVVYTNFGYTMRYTNANSRVQYQNIQFLQEWNLLDAVKPKDSLSYRYPDFKLSLKNVLLYNRADRFFQDIVADEVFYKLFYWR